MRRFSSHIRIVLRLHAAQMIENRSLHTGWQDRHPIVTAHQVPLWAAHRDRGFQLRLPLRGRLRSSAPFGHRWSRFLNTLIRGADVSRHISGRLRRRGCGSSTIPKCWRVTCRRNRTATEEAGSGAGAAASALLGVACDDQAAEQRD
jgi:hypothetical protein